MMDKPYTFNKSGTRLLVETKYKTFDNQTNYIGCGNCIANTQYSNYIRPYTETKCNTITCKEGELRDFDLKLFTLTDSLKRILEKYKNDFICLYEFYIHSGGSKKVIGWLIEKDGVIVETIYAGMTTPYMLEKKSSVLHKCKDVIEYDNMCIKVNSRR